MSDMVESPQLYDISLYMNFVIYLPEIEQHLMVMDGGQDMLHEHSGTLLQLCMAEKHQSVCLYRRREDSHEIGSQRRNLQVIVTGEHGVCEYWKQATQFEDRLRYIGDALRRGIYILSTTNDADEFHLVFQKAGQSVILLLNDL
ncbi:uncharacterized protein ARMOST_15259 [Armillaria ostoyae]|uniref:Uncharacterized protein n=1 Tax=Armillaria ostoyae TaxID=47428 RepID=A0A284RSX7_ARMOS|nr:uncharacterized protein ARMOST_15259 [Armillaria ostoyae]